VTTQIPRLFSVFPDQWEPCVLQTITSPASQLLQVLLSAPLGNFTALIVSYFKINQPAKIQNPKINQQKSISFQKC